MKHIQDLFEKFSKMPEELRPQSAPMVWERVFQMVPDPCKVFIGGAGRGGLSRVMNQAGYQVTSGDLHPSHFQVEGLTCDHIDLSKPLPFSDNQFDLIIAIEVMEHLEDPWLFFREALRVIKDNGKFIFSSPNVMSLYGRLIYMTTGLLPYFHQESFTGCYHVTPVFEWAVSRCCQTCDGVVDEIRYSRVDWPRSNDIPRYGGKFRRFFLNLLPCNRIFGEITIYSIMKKIGNNNQILQGYHPET